MRLCSLWLFVAVSAGFSKSPRAPPSRCHRWSVTLRRISS